MTCGAGDRAVKVIGLGGPGDEAGFGERIDAELPRLIGLRLLGVGPDDLDVGRRAQRD
jgi:hypothetical protein